MVLKREGIDSSWNWDIIFSESFILFICKINFFVFKKTTYEQNLDWKGAERTFSFYLPLWGDVQTNFYTFNYQIYSIECSIEEKYTAAFLY